jgi:hypothetical protein
MYAVVQQKQVSMEKKDFQWQNNPQLLRYCVHENRLSEIFIYV